MKSSCETFSMHQVLDHLLKKMERKDKQAKHKRFYARLNAFFSPREIEPDEWLRIRERTPRIPLALVGGQLTAATGVVLHHLDWNWEYSVREYLDGFSDAIVADSASPREKAEAILAWMRDGPRRMEANDLNELSPRDPTETLNYRQLLEVCGSATNAFLNLSRSTGLQTRRLLLLAPDRNTKHVVAEVLLDGRWVIVDPTYRVILKDAHGSFLTRRELQDPAIFREATSLIPNYNPEYNYESFAHVRLAALPLHGFHIRQQLDRFFPGWDEHLDWSLLLERRSFSFSFCPSMH